MPDESRGYRSNPEAYGQRHSPTRQEKAEQEARDQAWRDYTQSPAAGEISKLFGELQSLKEWKANLVGRNGILVTDTEITLLPNGGRFDQPGGVSSFDVQEEGSVVISNPAFLNFIGDIMTAEVDGLGAKITVLGSVEPVRIIVGGAAADVDFIIVPP